MLPLLNSTASICKSAVEANFPITCSTITHAVCKTHVKLHKLHSTNDVRHEQRCTCIFCVTSQITLQFEPEEQHCVSQIN